MDDALLDAYRRTAFVADTPKGRLSLRVGHCSAELDALLAAHRVTTWAYVTAFNPDSRLRPADVNAASQRELQRVVAERGFASYEGAGVGDDGRWPPEPSVLVLGIAREDAVRLGDRFGQVAIVYGEVGQNAELIVCNRGRGD